MELEFPLSNEIQNKIGKGGCLMELLDELWLLKQIYTNNSYWDDEKNVCLHPIPPSLSKEELKNMNNKPNTIIYMAHNECIDKLKRLAQKITLEQAAQSFVSSLWSAPIIWRSELTAKLLAMKMPDHDILTYTGSKDTCKICGYRDYSRDASFIWYQGMTTGTPLDGDILAHCILLEKMEKMVRPVPTQDDIWIFRAILTILRNLPKNMRYGKVREILLKEKLLPTNNKSACTSLLESLALIGILDTPQYPGLYTEYTHYAIRDHRPSIKTEVQAPLAWWNSAIGVNEETLQNLFPMFDCTSISLDTRPKMKKEETLIGQLAKKKKPREKIIKTPISVGKGKVQAGDVYAIRIREGVWVSVYCHNVDETNNKVKVEFLEGVFDHMPLAKELLSAFKRRPSGRWQQWTSSIEKTSWVRRIARGVPCPYTDEKEPDRIPFGSAGDLKYLAKWCFSNI